MIGVEQKNRSMPAARSCCCIPSTCLFVFLIGGGGVLFFLSEMKETLKCRWMHRVLAAITESFFWNPFESGICISFPGSLFLLSCADLVKTVLNFKNCVPTMKVVQWKLSLISSCVKYSDLACVNFHLQLLCEWSGINFILPFTLGCPLVPGFQSPPGLLYTIFINFQDPNLQLHPGKDTQPVTHNKCHRGPTEILRIYHRGPRVIQTARWGRFGQLEVFCWYKKCVLWCFCGVFFFGGGEVESSWNWKCGEKTERWLNMYIDVVWGWIIWCYFFQWLWIDWSNHEASRYYLWCFLYRTSCVVKWLQSMKTSYMPLCLPGMHRPAVIQKVLLFSAFQFNLVLWAKNLSYIRTCTSSSFKAQLMCIDIK